MWSPSVVQVVVHTNVSLVIIMYIYLSMLYTMVYHDRIPWYNYRLCKVADCMCCGRVLKTHATGLRWLAGRGFESSVSSVYSYADVIRAGVFLF